MNPSEPETRTPGGRSRLRAVLASRDRILCIAIVVAMVIPVVAVAAQIKPKSKGLPEATDFAMWDAQTLRSFRLSDYRGKVVFLDIMGTWCTVCREQMPDLKTINATYGGESFVMLSVTGRDPYYPTNDSAKDFATAVASMRAYRAEFSANWTFAIPFDQWFVDSAYIVSGFPTTVVIDRDGMMTYRAVGRVPLATLVAHIEAALVA